MQVLLGQEDLSQDPGEAGGLERRVARVIVHPDYRRGAASSLATDLAILELAAPLPATTHITPVCLPGSGSLLDNSQARSIVARYIYIAAY